MLRSKIGGFLALAALAASGACSRPSASASADNVRAAVLEWEIGVGDKEGPSWMVETVLPASHRGKEVWRVIHRDPDPTEKGGNSYDMYDVDRATLSPVRSVLQREGFSLALTFEGDRVAIEKTEGDQRSTSEVQVHNSMPEGPGIRVLIAGLPLDVGYTKEFPIVDRWARNDATRVKNVKLTVPRRRTIDTRLGRVETLEVELAANDGSSMSTHFVRTEPPRYPFRIEYKRGDLNLVSEVTRMVFAYR
jgi:hypothetical protein